MKPVDVTESIARLLKDAQERKHTGATEIRIDWNQGGIRGVHVDHTESKTVSYEIGAAGIRVSK